MQIRPCHYGGACYLLLLLQVHDIVVGAMLSAEPRINTEVKMKVPHRNVCFEVRSVDSASVPCLSASHMWLSLQSA